MRNLLLIVALLMPCALAQIPSLLRGCASPDVVQNFDVKGYLGKWYEQEKYPLVYELLGKCIFANYSANDDGTVKVYNEMIVGSGKQNINGKAELASTTGEAKLKVTFYDPVEVQSPYWVLDTDYTSYSVVFSCQELLGLPFTSVWILTREQNPPQSIIDHAYKVLKEKNINTSFLTKTDQKNCK